MQFNAEQRRIVKSKPNGHRLIKGVRGTGKTTVAVNKISTLLKYYCVHKTDRVLVATYTEESSKHAYDIYNNIEKDKYIQSSFFDEDNNDKLEIKTIDNLILYYFNEYIRTHKNNFEIASSIECENELINAINSVTKEFKKVKILNAEYIGFIKEEINWIKSCNYTKCEEYQIADRTGIPNCNKIVRLRKKSKQRQVIYEVLKEYNKNLQLKNKLDSQDIILLAIKEAKKKKSKKYTHIFIDESQALTKVQLEFLKTIYTEKSYSSITFIVDTDESIYPKGWLTKKKAFMSLGYNMKGKSNSLKQIYIRYNEINRDDCSLINEEHKIDIVIDKKEENNSKNSYALDTIEYVDLKRSISHKFIKDSSNFNELYIEEDGQETKAEDLSSIPVYNEIAAGSPILINDSFTDNYYLPKSWIRGSSQVFMLKIQGDSMINKNINDGDYVVINKQNYASVGDIVAVDIEGEATLKTYRTREDKILLMPENDAYEPITLDENQISIIGVAIGLLKN